MSSPEVPSTGAQREPRIDLWLEEASLRTAGGRSATVMLHDLSPSGFMTEWPYQLSKGERVWLKMPGLVAQTALVAWNKDFRLGCRFETPLHAAVFDQIVRMHAAGPPR